MDSQEQTENFNPDSLDAEGHELLTALNPVIDKNEPNRVLINPEAFQKALNAIKNKGEKIILVNELLGLSVVMESRTATIKELKGEAHSSMLFLMSAMPIRIPLGVG